MIANAQPTANSTFDHPHAQPVTLPAHGFGGPLHHCSERSLHYVSAADRQELIARLAYMLAEQRGFAPGGELTDWIAAEAQVGAGLGEG